MTGPRVGIDALALRVGGGVTWLQRLLPALELDWPAATFLALARPALVAAQPPGRTAFTACLAPDGARRVPFERRVVPAWAAAERLDVVLVAADAGPTRLPCPYVQVAQNVKLATGRGLRYRLLRRAARATARGAAATVFVSAAHAAACAPVLAPRRVEVVPHGVASPPADPGPRPVASPYVLVVATGYPHKDLPTAVRAVLAARRAGRPEVLAWVGAPGDVLAEVRAAAGADPAALLEVGAVTPAALEAWYAHAAALLAPSAEESSGMPVAEALARGVPVVASGIPAHLETAAGAARHHPVGDVAAATRALLDVLSCPGDRTGRLESGRAWASARTWAATAARYRRVLEACLPGGPAPAP